MERGGCGGWPEGGTVGGQAGARGRRKEVGRGGGGAEVRFEGRMRNEGKTLGNAASETRTMRKERKGVGWLALVFEFKYQTVRDRRGASGPQEPLQPENPRDSDTVFARN